MAVIAVLVLIYVTFQIMFTKPTGGKIAAGIAWMVIGLILLNVVIGAGSNFYAGLSPLYRPLFLVLAVIIASVVVFRMLIAKETWSELLAHVLHDVLAFLIFAPFRFGRWLLQLLFRPRQLPQVERANELSHSWTERGPHSR